MKPVFRRLNGRQQRRLEKRVAARKARPTRDGGDIPMIVKADYVLFPLEDILTRIELHGELDATGDGTYVFRAMDGGLYGLSGAVAGVAEFFDQWAIRHRSPLDLTPLYELADILARQEAIDGTTLDQVKELMPRLRAVCGRLSQAEASDLLLNSRILEAMGSQADNPAHA